MPRVALVALAAVIGACTAVIILTSGALPDLVASEFGTDGQPFDWMERWEYVMTTLAVAVAIPCSIIATVSFVARTAPQYLAMPHREYWFEPARRDETRRTLLLFACALAGVLVLFTTAFHLLIAQANTDASPHMADQAMYTLMGGFAVAIALWLTVFLRRFRRDTPHEPLAGQR